MPARFKYYADGTIIKSYCSVDDRRYHLRSEQFVLNFAKIARDTLQAIYPDYFQKIYGPQMRGQDEVKLLPNNFPPHLEGLCNAYKKPRKPKSYAITPGIRRRISSSTAKMALSKGKHENLLFITLTFSDKISERDANVCWSKFAENLKETYKLSGYVCVKELHISGIPHFHCILRMPYQDLMKLNDAWVHTWPKSFKYSNCAVRTDKEKGPKVKNVRRAVQYCTKYMTKHSQEGKTYTERCYFIDHTSLDPGNYCSQNFVNFVFEFIKCEKKDVHTWQHAEFPTVIYTIKEFYMLHEELLQHFIDNSV
jgi:hypothetical protein